MTTAPLPGMGATISTQPTIEAPVYDGPLVTITDRAAVKAKGILESKGQNDSLLRVFVVGGGCSGYQYGMSIAPSVEDGDPCDLRQGMGKFAQALCRLGKVARPEGAVEEVFDRIGMKGWRFGHDLKHGERL